MSDSGRFPMGDNPKDHLIQISTAFQRYGEPEPYHRSVVCFRETSPVDGVQIVWSDQEHKVIDLWAELLREHKADVLIGYNTSQVRSVSACFPFTDSSALTTFEPPCAV
jgi:DNA polymerase delta subunit 1